MEYIALNNWKELKKQNKYKEAAYALHDEIAYNLLRVHNRYSNIYLDENKYFEIGDLAFLYKMENNEKINLSFLDDFRECGIIVCGTIAAYEESNYEGDFDYPDKLLLKDIEVAYKLITRKIKKLKE